MSSPNLSAREFNFDGLVGPTHCYAGLSYGNIASMNHRQQVANPREAALQGLEKAYALVQMGLGQGIMAPQERPFLPVLRRIGFRGADAEILARAAKEAPELLAACTSSSSMWTANAATVSPSPDSADGKVHFTSANLNEKFHRSLEFPTTSRLLRAMFSSRAHFAHHKALPPTPTFGDEGAANHTRFCEGYGHKGLQFFVYGRVALAAGRGQEPKLFPARQTREASEAIVRKHLVAAGDVVFAQQNPSVIDAGAFHNDVVAVGNQNVLFYHEQAFHQQDKVLGELRAKFAQRSKKPFVALAVPTATVSLKDAVESYLFNSQLITLAEGSMVLIAPLEVKENPRVHQYLTELIESARSPIGEVRYFDVKQSMRNGGGPACLRLRVVLNEAEQSAMNQGVLLNESLYLRLKAWIKKNYRDRLHADDLGDARLLLESRAALDELTQILKLGSVYDFQS